jgi:hypothetical protein
MMQLSILKIQQFLSIYLQRKKTVDTLGRNGSEMGQNLDNVSEPNQALRSIIPGPACRPGERWPPVERFDKI